MAHTRQYGNCACIRIDAGQVRGYDKLAITSKPARFVAGAKSRLTPGGPPLLEPSAKYLDEVEDQLDEIHTSALGQALMQDLATAGKNIIITFPEIQQAITHKCAGSSSAITRSGGSDIWRKPFDQDVRANQLTEFQKAYGQATAAHHTDLDIANAINSAITDTNNAGGGATSRQSPVTAQEVHDWMAGNQPLPSKDEIRFMYLLWALERYLPNGDGAGSRIRWDPWNELTGASQRPAVVGLFHELVHAWHNATGRKLFSDDDIENEMMTVGIAPFDQIALGGGNRQFTENLFRPLMPLGARNQL